MKEISEYEVFLKDYVIDFHLKFIFVILSVNTTLSINVF